MFRILLILHLLILGSCFKAAGTSQANLNGRGSILGITTEDTSKKLKTEISASSSETLSMTMSDEGAMKGTSIAIAPGTLSVSTFLVIEEGLPIQETSMLSDMRLPADVTVNAASQGIIVRPADDVQLAKPLTISLPIPVLSSLNLAQVSYLVFAKYLDPTTNTLVNKVFPVDGVIASLKYSEAAGGDVVVLNSYFGAYWVVAVSRNILTAEVPISKESTDPIVNKLQTAVIASTGIITEKAVTQTQASAPLQLTTPVWNVVDTVRNPEISIASFAAIKACSIDVTEDVKAIQTKTLDASINFHLKISALRNEVHNLYARFRCMDTSGRAATSAWSTAYSVPAYPFVKVLNVSSANPVGSYGVGSHILIDINFTSNVTLVGKPSLLLKTDNAERSAEYVSGSGSKSLRFDLVINSGDNVAVLKVARKDALILPPAVSINDQNGLPVDLTLPLEGTAALGSVDKITLDTAPPVFGGVSQIFRKSPSEVMVFWEPASDSLSTASQIKYDLCVAASGTASCISNFVISQTIPSTTYNHAVTGLTPGTSYQFLVRAQDLAGNSSFGPSAPTFSDLSGISSVVAGDSHSCAIVGASQTVRCWGRNNRGQLGDGTLRDHVTPMPVPGLISVSKISLGDNHSCALLHDGSVKCWGLNDKGQLGTGDITDRLSPTIVSGLSGIVGVATGASHSCATLAAGTAVKCWGANNYSQLGDGTTTDRSSPVAVSSLSNVVSIMGGGNHSCALISPSNIVKCWGRNNSGQLGDSTATNRTTPVQVMGLTSVTSLTLGYDHSCAIQNTDQKVRCWGYNNYGQLGDGSNSNRLTSVNPYLLGTASAVFAGFYNTCAILIADGTTKCWGLNSSSQLGIGTNTNSTVPVDPIGISNLQSLAIGWNHICGLNSTNQTLKCWGTNNYGQLGLGSDLIYTMPVKVSELPLIEQFESGANFYCAIIKSDRSVRCWGDNNYGQLGDGTKISRSTPVPVAGVTGVSSITLGYGFACALLLDGSMKCWGQNMIGALGNNSTVDSLIPVSVQNLPVVRSVAATDWSVCAIVTSDDSVMCWGDNSRSALGDGTTTSRYLPTAVTGLIGVDKIYASAFSVCALMKIGKDLKCWGDNAYGILGDGTISNRSTPTDVIGLEGVAELSMGVFHACATTLLDGSVYCWGINTNGQLGDGSTSNQLGPVRVPGIKGASLIAAGYSHSCAVLGSEQKAFCWGDNTNGELGMKTNSSVNSIPQEIKGLSGINGIVTSRITTCVSLGPDRTLRCWGGNAYGELGIGGRIFQLTSPGDSISALIP